jgi:hypothetical protein
MKNKNTFNTIVTVAFVLLAFVLLILMSAGISLEFDRLADVNYWINILIRLVVMMLLYNVIFTFDLQQRKNEPNTAHYIAVATKQLRINRIKRENLFAELGKAVDAENEERYATECTRRLHKVSVRVNFEDLPKEPCDISKWLTEMQEKYLINEKDLKRLENVALKILNGKVKIRKLTADDILDMLGDDNEKNNAIIFCSNVLIRYQNLIKAAMFLLGVTAMTVFRWHPSWTDIVFDVIINSTLLIGATYSAIINSKFFLKRKTIVFNNQNTLLAKRMYLTEEYKC